MPTPRTSKAEPHRRIRSLRGVLVVAATISLLTLLAPTAFADSHGRKTFHLAKNCDTFPICVVTASSDRRIPVGTEITYADTSVFPNALIPTVHGKGGSATGLCDLSAINAGTGPGTCVFDGGTGSLKHFRIDLAVTFDGTLWYWDGPIRHRHGHDGDAGEGRED